MKFQILTFNQLFLISGLLLWISFIGWDFWNPKNELVFRDITRMVLPNFSLICDALRNKWIPLIDLRKGAGMPFLLDPQTCALYPLTWIFGLFDFNLGFRVFQFFHLFWLGLGFSLIGLRYGCSLWWALIIGCSAIATLPHLIALEWMHTTAGIAWVPWTIFFSYNYNFFGILIAIFMMITSGHAYLWVMTPVIFISLFPNISRKQYSTLLITGLVATLFTFPSWGGYLYLTKSMIPHGIPENAIYPVVGFEPIHSLGFIIPNAFRSFAFPNPDGSWRTVRQYEFFSWTRKCYTGILPLFLAFLVIFFVKDRKTLSGKILLVGGFALSMILPCGKNLFPKIFQHMYHPATFIELSVLGILLLMPFGIAFLNNISIENTKQLKHIAKILGITSALTIVVSAGLAHLAYYEIVSPIWYHLFKSGWSSFALICVYSCLLLYLLSQIENRKLTYMKTAFIYGIFGTLQLIDCGKVGISAIPQTLPQNCKINSILNEVQPNNGRIFAASNLVNVVRQVAPTIPEKLIPFFFGFVKAAALPNILTWEGFHHFSGYNPPFQNSSLDSWIKRIESEDKDNKKVLYLLSNIRYLLTIDKKEAETLGKIISELEVGDLFTVYLSDLGHAFPACLMPPNELNKLDSGQTPNIILPIDQSNVSFQRNRIIIQLSTFPEEINCLFIPISDMAGWKISGDKKPLDKLPRNGFGIAINIPVGTKTVEIYYNEPFLLSSGFALALGIIFLILTRKKFGLPP